MGNTITPYRPLSRVYLPPEGERDGFWEYWNRLHDLGQTALDDARRQFTQQIKYEDHFTGSSFNQHFWTSTGGGGALAIVSGDGGYLSLMNNFGGPTAPTGLHCNGVHFIKRARNPILEVRCQLSQITQTFIQFGFIIYGGLWPATQDYIVFQNNSAGAAANWFGNVDATTDALGSASVDLGVLGDLNNRRFRFVVDNSIPAVKFYVENLTTGQFDLKGVLTTGIPISLMEPFIIIGQNAAGAVTSLHDYFKFYLDES